MKIASLHISGYKIFTDVQIDRLDPHLNLFIGVNGAGKSTILDAIAVLLSAYVSRLSSADGKGAKISVDEINHDFNDCTLSLTLDDGLSWTKYKSRKRVKDDTSDFRELNLFARNYRAHLDENKDSCVPVIVHYGVKRSVNDISLKVPKTEEPSPTLAYKDWVDSKASYQDIFPWIRNEEDYENELIRDNPHARDRGLEALRRAMTGIFPDYTDMRVRRKPRLELVLRKKGKEFGFSQLSDGEKCYIALVCDIVRRLSIANPSGDILYGDGIVLIDEVDLHLHPSWEQSVMEKLRSTFPNIQFIVSAHSPLVASHFEGNVYAVGDGMIAPLPRLFGLDYSTILQDWMETSPDNRAINSLIDLYRAYSANGMQAQAEAVKSKLLEKLDGDANAEVLKNL